MTYFTSHVIFNMSTFGSGYCDSVIRKTPCFHKFSGWPLKSLWNVVNLMTLHQHNPGPDWRNMWVTGVWSDRYQLSLGCIRNNDFCRCPRNGDGEKSSKLSHQRLLQSGQWKQQDSVWKYVSQGNKMLSLETRVMYVENFPQERHDFFFSSELVFL